MEERGEKGDREEEGGEGRKGGIREGWVSLGTDFRSPVWDFFEVKKSPGLDFISPRPPLTHTEPDLKGMNRGWSKY